MLKKPGHGVADPDQDVEDERLAEGQGDDDDHAHDDEVQALDVGRRNPPRIWIMTAMPADVEDGQGDGQVGAAPARS